MRWFWFVSFDHLYLDILYRKEKEVCGVRKEYTIVYSYYIHSKYLPNRVSSRLPFTPSKFTAKMEHFLFLLLLLVGSNWRCLAVEEEEEDDLVRWRRWWLLVVGAASARGEGALALDVEQLPYMTRKDRIDDESAFMIIICRATESK